MNEVFVIRNQLGHYWGKGKAWVDGSDPRTVLRVKHHDEGVNTLVELSARDITLRGEVLAAELGPKGEPVLTISEEPLPLFDEAEPATGDEPATDGQPPEAEAPQAGEQARSANGA